MASAVPVTRTSEIYNLVYDDEQVMEFARLIDTEHSYHQLCIVARPKYHAGAKNRHMSSKAFANYTPKMYLDLVRKYELPAGSYNDNGTPYPDDCLVIYGTTNSRDGKQAAKEFVEEIIDASFGKTDEGIFKHLAARLDSAIARSRVKTKLLTVDIDSKDEWPEVKEFLAQHKITPAALIETRGGYHVILDVDDLPVLKGELHKKFSIKHTIGDMMCAVPGTIQGGFPVRFVR